MVKLYKCFTDDNKEDYCVEVWGECLDYPNKLMYFSDFDGSFEEWQKFCIDETNSDELKNLFLTFRR